ncbi:MAG: hypothetical protein HYV94_02280 [Candidatus Rokubacteria bacterium]|nr:hypothetical protein [Candidatus Rokubacteria bacterium]
MRRLGLAAVLLLLTAGCAFWPAGWPLARPSATLLAEADRLAGAGEYAPAVVAYDEFLGRYPDDGEAPRALARRDTLASILAAREDLARLRQEVGRLADDLGRREAELARLKQELARRQAELERLKQIDMRLPQRRQ